MWSKTGLLEGIQENRMDAAAKFLNEITLDLLSKEPKVGTPEHTRIEHIAGMVIPIGRRLFDKDYPTLPDPKKLVENFSNFFDEKQDLFEDLKTTPAQDYEHEFVELYLTSYEPTNTTH